MKTETVSILGVKVARMSMDQVLEWCRIMVEQEKPRHLVTANAEIVYRAYNDPEFARLVEKADLVTADGSGVVWASRLLGSPVPERVSGIDLVNELLVMAEKKGWGVYFLGGQKAVAEKAVLNTLSAHPRLKVCGYRDGYYSQEEEDQVVSNIYKEKAQILLAALGSPKQEAFIQSHLKELNTPLCIGVGGTFDVLAGVAERAPAWMRDYGLEWLHRLLKSPSRWRRVAALPRFVGAVLRQRLRGKLRSK